MRQFPVTKAIRFGLLLLLVNLASTCAAFAQTDQNSDSAPVIQLGPGDQVKLDFYGQPDMDTTTYISDSGELHIALVGAVNVSGLSPALAAQRLEAALRDGKFLVNPHVTVTVIQVRNQRVSVLGNVRQPGQYPVDGNTTILDVIAAAGGTTELAGDTAYILRPDPSGTRNKITIDLRAMQNSAGQVSLVKLKVGDSVVIPNADQFKIYGEVKTPGTYHLHGGMHVFDAVALAGGLTDRGSIHRIEVRRKKPDGSFATLGTRQDDEIQPDDVIRIKESIF
jgi:polysaccharide biosynthesis/export protein